MLWNRWSRWQAAVLIVVVLAAAAAAPSASRAQELLFEDDYSMLDPAFGEPAENLDVDNGELFMKLDANQWWRYLYESMVFEDADIRVKVKLADMTAEQGTGVGLMFWASAIDDMYLLEISDSGTYAVRRFMPNRFLYPVMWRQDDAIKTDPDEWNELRVVTRGNRATISINGKELVTIKGRPPEGGSLIGLFSETGEAADETRFSSLQAYEAEPSDEAVPEDDPSVFLADKFDELDPAWGVESGAFGVKDGVLFISPDPGYTWTKLYEGDILNEDMDASVKVRIKGGEGDYSVGALAFWATAYDDYWALMVFDDGTMSVGHWMKTKWLWPMRNKAIPDAVKYDKNGFTELRVKTEGRKATFSLNGVEVGKVSGMPPKDGFYIGMFNEAGDKGATIEYDDFVVKRP